MNNIEKGQKENNFVFFGTPRRAAKTLEILRKRGLTPSLIVTRPDRRAGRGRKLTEPEVKVWAKEYGIEFIQPEKLDESFIELIKEKGFEYAVVVAYGKIVPKKLIDLFPKGMINVHYSLLPLYRGATPVETQILDGAEVTGITIMLIDEKVDHGAVLAQEAIPMPDPLPSNPELVEVLTKLGADLLADTLPGWLGGEIEEQEQDHTEATFTRKFEKTEGEIDLSDDAAQNFRKIQAFNPWPGTFFFRDGKRVKITQAHLENDELVIDRVTPEGKKEMDYKDFEK